MLLLVWDLLVAVLVLATVVAFVGLLFMPVRRGWVPSEVVAEVMAEAAAEERDGRRMSA